jgi:hypothetical protein
MTVFDTALGSLFADDNLTQSGIWRSGGQGVEHPVRIQRVQPQPVFEISGAKLVQDATLFDIQAKEASGIAEGDTLEVSGVIYRVQATPISMMDGRILRLDVVAS